MNLSMLNHAARIWSLFKIFSPLRRSGSYPQFSLAYMGEKISLSGTRQRMVYSMLKVLITYTKTSQLEMMVNLLEAKAKRISRRIYGKSKWQMELKCLYGELTKTFSQHFKTSKKEKLLNVSSALSATYTPSLLVMHFGTVRLLEIFGVKAVGWFKNYPSMSHSFRDIWKKLSSKLNVNELAKATMLSK